MTSSAAGTVLLIDDDLSTRYLLRASLEREGFSVQEVDNGEAALADIERQRPDLIVLDLFMPGMDGFEVCRRIRANPASARTPVLVITGLEDEEGLQRAYDLGATDVIGKPVQWKLLGYRARYLVRAARAFEQVALSQANMLLGQQSAQLGSWEWDVDAGRVYWSDQMYAIMGMEAGQVPPSLESFLDFVDARQRGAVAELFARVLRKGGSAELEAAIRRPNGAEVVVHLRADARTQDNRTAFMHGTLQDITERRRREEKIHELAYFDSLTGLPNRRSFIDQLTRSIALARRAQRTLVTMFIDVDDLKRINDTLGHDAGDAMLREVGRRLVAALRSSDSVGREGVGGMHGTVARIGGDEFTVLLPEVNQSDDAAVVARRLLMAISAPMVLMEQEQIISASLGVAIFPEDAEEAEDLIKAADTAMYHAKASGKGNFRFFTQPMNVIALRRLMLETELRQALERNEFELYFQPQIDISSGSIVCAEALLRWHHPQRGLLAPREFLSTAESCGLIVPIGAWVLQAACRQAQAWANQGIKAGPIAVNVSPASLRDRGFGALVAQTLQQTGLPPQNLTIELTEVALMHDRWGVGSTLEELTKLGVRLLIDDFGMGSSSLNRLRQLPLEALKIDTSCVENVEADAVLASAVIAVGKSLGVAVVAEGVETQAQKEKLRSLGCTLMQGNLFGAAMPASDFERQVRAV